MSEETITEFIAGTSETLMSARRSYAPAAGGTVQPPQSPFHHPAVHSQPAAVFRAPPSQGRRDVEPP